MELIYSTDNKLEIINYKNIFENEVINSNLKNTLLGGGSDPGHSQYLELWVDKQHLAKATQILESINTETELSEWICDNCKEPNESNFKICWNCSNADS